MGFGLDHPRPRTVRPPDQWKGSRPDQTIQVTGVVEEKAWRAGLAATNFLSRSGRAAAAWSMWPSSSSRCARRVALKVIKLGMDTRQVVARFEAERQALALMDHPNIAKVLDAGATETRAGLTS